jgi:hypothetical protein
MNRLAQSLSGSPEGSESFWTARLRHIQVADVRCRQEQPDSAVVTDRPLPARMFPWLIPAARYPRSSASFVQHFVGASRSLPQLPHFHAHLPREALWC